MTDTLLTINKSLALIESGVVFKKPNVPKKKVKVKKAEVLDEETYLDDMGRIIERDFFPDLEKLKAQNDYLEALDKNDLRRLRELHEKYTPGAKTPSVGCPSPATFETPLRETDGDDLNLGGATPTPSVEERKRKANLSLDQYLAQHTSEDNESFEEIIKESQERHQQKNAWLYKTEQTNVEALEHNLNAPSIAEQASDESRPLNVETWGYKNRNYIMFVPDGVNLTPSEEVEMAKRKKEITHHNTRFQVKPFDENQNKEKIQGLAHSQAKALDGKIGVDGKEVVSETPKIQGFNFVTTPSPAPGVSDTPLMTWGEIEGTPFRLDGADTPIPSTPGPSFSIPEPPKRERLALKLADKVNEKHRDSKRKAIETARRQLNSPLVRHSPGTSLDRLQMLSPAAQKFATSTISMGIRMDKALMASYTPNSLLATTPKTPFRPSPAPSPSASPAHTVKVTTDNLLKLNVKRRPKASDFFD